MTRTRLRAAVAFRWTVLSLKVTSLGRGSLSADRPSGKGRVERQVDIVRAHVVAGRCFDSLAEMDQAFGEWLPIRRAQVHRTHGEVIACARRA